MYRNQSHAYNFIIGNIIIIKNIFIFIVRCDRTKDEQLRKHLQSQTEVEGIYKYSGPIYFKFQRVNELICVILKLQLFLSRKEHMIWGWDGRYYKKMKRGSPICTNSFCSFRWANHSSRDVHRFIFRHHYLLKSKKFLSCLLIIFFLLFGSKPLYVFHFTFSTHKVSITIRTKSHKRQSSVSNINAI